MVPLQSLNCRRSAASLNACTIVTATFQEPKQPQKITVWNFVSTLFTGADMSTGCEGYFFVCLLFGFPYIVMNKKGEFWDQNWGLCCDPQNHIRAGVGWDFQASLPQLVHLVNVLLLYQEAEAPTGWNEGLSGQCSKALKPQFNLTWAEGCGLG